ncbi:hypothetical protein LAY57_13755 [Argonema antarcticum A004/B2]|nr:hypothetical protein [Argonema antarcticum A004/B2]
MRVRFPPPALKKNKKQSDVWVGAFAKRAGGISIRVLSDMPTARYANAVFNNSSARMQRLRRGL